MFVSSTEMKYLYHTNTFNKLITFYIQGDEIKMTVMNEWMLWMLVWNFLLIEIGVKFDFCYFKFVLWK